MVGQRDNARRRDLEVQANRDAISQKCVTRSCRSGERMPRHGGAPLWGPEPAIPSAQPPRARRTNERLCIAGSAGAMPPTITHLLDELPTVSATIPTRFLGRVAQTDCSNDSSRTITMPEKSCPNCGRPITFSEYVRRTSLHFECRGCGIALSADLQRAMLAPLVSTVPLALTLSQALQEPWWWIGVAAALAFSFLLHFWLFRVRMARRAEASSSRG